MYSKFLVRLLGLLFIVNRVGGFRQFYPQTLDHSFGNDGSSSGLVYSMLEDAVGALNNGRQFDLHNPRSHDAYLDEAFNQLDPALDTQTKDYDNGQRFLPDYDIQETMIRDQEYLQHSSLWGHQYVAGGAGEGKQRLKPDGSIKNIQEVKTDMLPAYCNPPNPCPKGYTEEDGCLEAFVNTADFSREYQAAQECMCDTEHMFDCPSSTRENEINAIAQSIQNEGVMDEALNKIIEDFQIHGQHKNMVAKKHQMTQKEKYLRRIHDLAKQSEIKNSRHRENPYLEGEKLPIVAKKNPINM